MVTQDVEQDERSTEPGSVKEMVHLAWPTLIGMLSFTLMDVADTFFVGLLGVTQLAAVGISSMFAFVINSFALGLFGAFRVIIAQLDGGENREKYGAAVGTAFAFALTMGILFCGLRFVSSDIFALLGGSEEVQALAGDYFDVRTLGLWAFIAMTTLGNVLKGTGEVKIPMRTNVFINALNIVLDPIFIFGWAGISAMGMNGAAWATNVACVVGFIIMFWAARKHFPMPWKFEWSMLKTALRYGIPMGLQFTLEALAWTIFMGLMGRVSDAALAANTAVMRIISVSFLPGYGISEAANILTGRYSGARRPDLVKKVWISGLKVGISVMGAFGILFFTIPEHLIGVFSSDPEIVRYGVQFLSIAALFQIFDATTMISQNSLNGAGDTRFTMIVSLSSAWLVFVPLANYLVMKTDAGAVGAWYAICTHLGILSVVLGLRFLQGGWRGKTLYDEARV